MITLEDLARQCLEQHYFIGHDGLLYTPVGRAARSSLRVGRAVFPSESVIAEMQRQARVGT